MTLYEKSPLRFFSFCGAALLLLGHLACERDTSIQMDGKVPPTFEFSGNGDTLAIEFRDLSPSSVPVNSPERIVWKIKVPDGRRPSGLPRITYGTLPTGFRQEEPATGAPQLLIEERPYMITVPTSEANGDSMIFIIRNAKALKVTKGQDGHYYVAE